MALKKHTVTADTLKNLLFKSAVVYKNLKFATNEWTGSTMGATSGGVKFNYTPEYGNAELDGATVSVKGAVQKFGEKCDVVMNITEFTQGVVVDAMHLEEDDTETVTGYTKFKTKALLTDDDYLENVGVVGTLTSGKDIILIFENAICLGALQLDTKDKTQATYEVTYECTADVEQEDLNHLPIYMYFPTEDTVSPTNLSNDEQQTPTV